MPLGLFEFNCMPFWLSNTSNAFQRLMERGCKQELKWQHTPYGVEKQPLSPTLVYDIVSEGSNPIRRHIHLNFLRPFVQREMFQVSRDSIGIRNFSLKPPCLGTEGPSHILPLKTYGVNLAEICSATICCSSVSVPGQATFHQACYE